MSNIEDYSNAEFESEEQECYGVIVSILWSNNGWTEQEKLDPKLINYRYPKENKHTLDCWNFSHEVHNIDGWHVGFTSSFDTHLPTEEKRESIKYLFFRSLDFNTKENKIIGYYKDPQFGAFTVSDGFKGNIRARIDDMVLFKNPILVKDIASVGYKSNGEPKEISKQGYTYINKEVVDTLLQTQQQSYKEDIQKFKHVLEYFVTHINYINSNENIDNIPGYNQYLKQYIDNGTFNLSGNGINGQKIQSQISQWDQIGPYHLCIYILGEAYYLKWGNTNTYISVRERNDNNTMNLYIDVSDIPTKKKKPHILEYPIEKLGLYDGINVPTKELQRFFDKFYELAQGIKNEHITTYKMEGLAKYINLLRENYNIILNGAPGTGKTFLAKEIAAEMVAGKSYTELSDTEKIRIGFVQFHPSFDYTDFTEGLRPIKDINGIVSFKRMDGTFKTFCNNALNNPKSKFVFIIDEINRGELSKIFGELFFSIDPGYREKENRVKVKTQYQNLVEEGDPFYEGFYIPENVYIIGTMNDIDRSVESMDFAMRRRFTFTEITAKESERILNSVKEWPKGTNKKGLIKKMEALNSAIEKVEGLSSAFHLGGAYFKKIEKCESYVELWDQYLESIVKEYLRGMPKAEELLKTLKAAYNGTKEEEE